MWKRLRRRTMTPGRPIIFPEQLGLLLLSIGAIGGGIWVTLEILFP